MFKKYFDKKTVVVFDLDGAVIDSEKLWFQAFKNVTEKVSDNHFLVYLPAGLDAFARWDFLLNRYVKTDLSIRSLVEYVYKEYIDLFLKSNIEPLNGFWDFAYDLKVLYKYKLVLSSRSSKAVTDMVVKKLGLDKVFDLIITTDEVTSSQPYEDIFKYASVALKTSINSFVVFDDAPIGIEAALNLKIQPFVIYTDSSISKTDFKKHLYLPFLENYEGMSNFITYSNAEDLKLLQKKLDKILKKRSIWNLWGLGGLWKS